ncbi:MAG: hypothetical protein ACTHNU_07535 [Gaiellales bacterium]
MFRVRLITLAAVAVAVLAAATTAGANMLIPANCNCGSFWASGNTGASGWLRASASGAVWGNVSSGTLWVQDREFSHHFTVTLNGKREWLADKSEWKFTGRNITFQVWGKWWVQAHGSGVAMSATAQGTASLKGTGRYDLNGGPSHDWPSIAHQIQLRG